MYYDWAYDMTDKCLLVLTAHEADLLAKVLQREQRYLEKKVTKYRDILDGGEATERQQTILDEAADELEIVEIFIKKGLIKKDKK